MPNGPGTRAARGFTLLELMIVVTILGIVASIGVPQYVSALRTARVGKARHELRTIATAIDSYTATHDGKLPLSLYQVGFGGRSDPWGVPYCYLNYADGTGDGLDWAIAAGVVDPSAFQPITGGGAGGGDGGGGWPSAQSPMVPQGPMIPQNPMVPEGPVISGEDALSVGAAGVDLDGVAQRVGRELTLLEGMAVQSAVAERGAFSFFSGVQTEQTRRRDRYMFPLNTDYDLFSLGPDRLTATSLGESVGLDDVIRANNGGFFGSASDY